MEDDNRGGYNLNIDFRAAMPDIDAAKAQHVLNLARQSCPDAKATCGNIHVALGTD